MSSRSFSLRMAEIVATQFLSNAKYSKSRYVLTESGLIFCSECCHSFRERFALLDNWLIKTDCVNKQNRFLKCNGCSRKILAIKPIKLVLDK